jgi:hypothetical protein
MVAMAPPPSRNGKMLTVTFATVFNIRIELTNANSK